MQVTLDTLSIKNLKGIKDFTFTPNGTDACLLGQNGAGKTSVKAAQTWLFFGKDEQWRQDSGKGKFEIHPLDANNVMIPGLTPTVEGHYRFDDEVYTFKRSLVEKTGSDAGWETRCWINEVPKKVGEYVATIKSLIGDENVFKLVTDLHYFLDELEWKKRRDSLMVFTGPIAMPKKFDGLQAEMAGRSIDDFKKVVKSQCDLLNEELDKIPIQIGEQQLICKEYAKHKDTDLPAKRDAIKAQITALDDQRTALLASESARSAKLDAINVLKAKKSDRETALRNDTVGHAPLYEEKAALESKIAEKKTVVQVAQGLILSKKTDITLKQTEIDTCQASLEKIRADYMAMKALDFSQSACNACGQTLAADRIESLAAENRQKMAKMAVDGNTLKQNKIDLQKQMDALADDLGELMDALDKAQIELTETQTYATGRAREIDELLSHRVIAKPENDPLYKQLCSDITRAETEVGPSISDQLTALEQRRQVQVDLLTELNTALSSADTAEKAATRIDELKAREKELGVQIAALDGKLDMIGQYQAHQSEMIEKAVNGRFQKVRFKLFNTLLNGSIEPCCEAMLNGTPYSDCSYGEKNVMGADVVNVLGEHFKLNAPVFVDNAESLTLPLGLKCQVIRLQAHADVKELTADFKSTPMPQQSAPTDGSSPVAGVSTVSPTDAVSEGPDSMPLEAPTEPESPEPVEQEQQGGSAPKLAWHCNECKKDFDSPVGKGKTKLCRLCLSKNIVENK